MNSACTHVTTIKSNCPDAREVAKRLQKTTSRHIFVEEKRLTTGTQYDICGKGACNAKDAEQLRKETDRIIAQIAEDKLAPAA